jgi:hypothetical protein
MSAFLQMVRSRWFATVVHAGLWCILYLAVTRLGGKTPDIRLADTTTPSPPNPVPAATMESLFSPGQWPNPQAVSNFTNPFFTTHFVPPPSPTPPPATTRKVEVTYQGFYEAGDTVKHIVTKVGDLFVVAVIGAPITTNLFIADASMQSLLLTNHVSQTNLVPLNAKRDIEVPLK